MWRKRNTWALLWLYVGAATVENSMEFSQILRVELPYDPAIPLLVEENKNTHSKRYMHSHVHCSTIWNRQNMEASVHQRRVDTEDVVYVCIYIYIYILSHEKECNPASETTWVDLKGIMISETNLIKKGKYYVISLILGIRKWANITKGEQTYRHT